MDIKFIQFTQSLLIACLTFLPSMSSAAPLGTLPSSPLYLSNSVEPNIFYIIDDSGSMEFETLMRNGIAGIETNDGDPKYRKSTDTSYIEKRYVIPDYANGRDGKSTALDEYEFTVPSSTVWDLAWVARTHHGNAIYYNPAIDYKPWPGSNSDGTPLYNYVTDATQVMLDPNNPSAGTINLTAPINFKVGVGADSHEDNVVWENDTLYPATYYEWDDDKGDIVGVLEAGEKGRKIEIRNDGTADAFGAGTYPSGRTYAQEILNFANWYQYHRKRSYVAKNAIGHTILNTDNVRSGYSAFNGYYTPPGNFSTYTVKSLSNPADKLELLKNMYGHEILCGRGKDKDGGSNYPYPNTCKGTPGREALIKIGKLFEGTLDSAVDQQYPSPIQSAADGGSCQQNFDIFLSDGYWNSLNDTGEASLTETYGNADKDDDGTQVDGFDGGRYADNYSVTLADIAMYYYEHDLSGLPNIVPTISGVDEATHQHLVTYTIALGLKGTLTTHPSTTDTTFAWPDASTSTKDERRVDDLEHAAYNSRGKYLDASNPAQLQTALSDAIEDIASRTAIGAAVAVNSGRLTTNSVVYVARFNSNRWQGSLAAYPIGNTTLGTLADEPNWRAEEKLNARPYTNDPAIAAYRNIITHNGTTGVPFKWSTANLSAEMQADLRTNPLGGTDSDAIASARLEYLRGDRSSETSQGFRSRLSLLGDIVNSGPVFVGKSDLAWPDTAPFPSASGSRYSDFKNGLSNTRAKTVYVGANDGFLHAFDDTSASTWGKEIFAYAPNILASSTINKGYHYLTDPGYVHQWYVDLTPTISDVYLTTGFGNGWHTVLIGGLRGGGRGLFALDITNPANLTESNANKVAMWEFSSSNDNDLGYSYSRPAIAMANNGRWYAIFGNGYNDQGSGQAKLFILDIEAGVDGWAAGDYIEITTGVGDANNRNGLASPALIDTDGNGTVDRVYAGDLRGNMWAFDMSSASTSQWGVAYKAGQDPKPLFTAEAGQPITTKPVIAKHPTIPYSSSPSNAPNMMVYFGTGQYLVNADIATTTTQSFYGVWDNGDSGLNRTDDLIAQTIETSASGDTRFISRNAVDYSTKMGWYFNLTDSGERAVTNPIARGGAVFFNTFIPAASNACSSGGHGWQLAVDMTTGGSPLEAVIDYTKNGVVDQNDLVNGRAVAGIKQAGYQPEPTFIEDLKYDADVPTKVKELPDVPEGRFSWQELIK